MKSTGRLLKAAELRVSYYPLMLIASLAWPLYYNTGPLQYGLFSYTLQQLSLFALLQSIDTLSPWRKLKYAAAGIASCYVFMVHFNAFLLSITSMNLYESLVVLATGGDFIYTLEEAGFSTGLIIAVVMLMALVFATGGAIYRFMPAIITVKKKAALFPLLTFTLCASLFTAEQIINRDTPGFFWRRIYPLYIELFSTGKNTLTLKMDHSRLTGDGLFASVTSAANPKNVLVVILESFRADSISKDLSPEMAMLARDAFASPAYHTGAIYTSLAWNSLLMDSPAHTFSQDIEYDRLHNPGSSILRVFRNAGYRTYMAFSANMEWKGFHKRVNGADSLIDNYYCAYLNRTEDRNLIDNRTTARAVEWIKESRRSEPFAMILQLDSTHWTYYADPEHRISMPCAGKEVNIAALRNPADIELLANRYRNSVRQVNACISRITGALKDKGIFEDTALVIVSDHGEGFAPGMIGHSVLHDDIKKPAFIMRLPGKVKYASQEYIADTAIFPTLFDYLGIKVTGGLLRGRSLLDPGYKKKSVLSFHGSLLMADLTSVEYRVLFRINMADDLISFTPVYATDSSGRIITDTESTGWQNDLREIFTR